MRTIVYLPIKPDVAKENNLPLKLPILIEDLPLVTEKDRIPLDVIIRGLEAQVAVKDDGYYSSYLVYFYYEKVKELVSRGDLKGALGFVEKAGEILKDYRYHFYRGIVFKKMGRTGEAEVEFKISSSKSRKFSLALYELGNLYLEMGEYRDAEEAFKKTLERDPDFALPLVKLGDVKLAEGDVEEALKFYTESLKKDPGLPDVYNRIGVVENILQRFEEAETAFKRALEIYPSYPDALYNLAYTKVKLGRVFESLSILLDLEKRFPDDVKILNELGIVMREVGLFEESVERLERAFEISKEDYVGYNLVRSLAMIDVERAFEIADSIDGGMRENALELLEFYMRSPASVSLSGWDEVVDSCGDLVCVLESLDLDDTVGERVADFLDGTLPMEDTDIDTRKLLDLVLVYSSRGKNFAEMEKRSIEISSILYGNGTMLGVVRVLIRLFQSVADVHSIVEEVKDLDWKLALRLSKVEEKPVYDSSGRGSDLAVSLLSHVVHSVVPEDETLRTLYEELERVIG